MVCARAASEVVVINDSTNSLRFATDGWGPNQYSVLLANVTNKPVFIWSKEKNASVEDFEDAQYQYVSDKNWLIITNVTGNTEFYVSSVVPEPFNVFFIFSCLLLLCSFKIK